MADILVYLQKDVPLSQFHTFCQKELTGLLEKSVFKIIKLADVSNRIRLFNLQFVDKIKNPGTELAFKKLRLVVQAYNNAEKKLVLTQSPTI